MYSWQKIVIFIFGAMVLTVAIIAICDGTTYRALSAIPNPTNSFYGAIIPEPAALSLLALGALAVLKRKRTPFDRPSEAGRQRSGEGQRSIPPWLIADR